jgi:hypothetical protein
MMGQAVFASMTTDVIHTRDHTATSNTISMDSYLDWQKEYTFDALRDFRYGQSFCNRFNVQDNRIFYERDWVRCDIIIRSEWLERP